MVDNHNLKPRGALRVSSPWAWSPRICWLGDKFGNNIGSRKAYGISRAHARRRFGLRRMIVRVGGLPLGSPLAHFLAISEIEQESEETCASIFAKNRLRVQARFPSLSPPYEQLSLFRRTY